MMALWVSVALAELRPVEPFEAVVNTAPMDVTIAIGDHQAIQIDGPMEITQRVGCEVKKGVLTISIPKGLTWTPEQEPRVNITLPALREIGVDSVGNVAVQGRMAAAEVRVWTRGSGQLAVDDLAGGSVSITLEGAGKFTARHVVGDPITVADPAGVAFEALSMSGPTTATLAGGASFTVRRFTGTKLDLRAEDKASAWVTGTTPFLFLNASDTAQIELPGLQVERATVTASGTSRVHVVTEAELEVTATDRAFVAYSGSGRTITHVTGNASVEPRRSR